MGVMARSIRMTLAALAFACGAAALQWQAALPAWGWFWLLPPLAVLSFLTPRFLPLLALAAGFLWAAAFAHLRMADWLAPQLEGRDLAVIGVISSLPARMERGVRFELEVESAPNGERLPKKLLLSWYRSPAYQEEQPALLEREVHPGERWLLTVRLRRPHGSVNPNGFDYEAWLLERGIGATGYVRQKGVQQLVGTRNGILDWVERAREGIRDRFEKQLGATPAAGILIALAVGDQRAISAEEWRLFNRTGVTHLMSL
jgi:competence protein ComEC